LVDKVIDGTPLPLKQALIYATSDLRELVIRIESVFEKHKLWTSRPFVDWLRIVTDGIKKIYKSGRLSVISL
jgi:hypothetical protein